MQVDARDVLEDGVHRPAVVELLLELDALPRHLDAHKHAQQRLRHVAHQGMLGKQARPVVAVTCTRRTSRLHSQQQSCGQIPRNKFEREKNYCSRLKSYT